MTDLLHTTQTALSDWAQKAINAGWLAPDALEQVSSLNVATPGQLFDGAERPLVVGFFGGTGVGKSSLMNRLAGDAVARASAERPTSTDITAYVHTSARVDRLPADFPMDKLRTAMHHNEKYASVLWLDMPDFDSVETSHRGLVEQWLPYIDVLVYVVSPERYRDDEGWRMLLQHGQRHAWLFVINHWDRGDPVQREDFQSLLVNAGLDNPLLFCTDCNPDKPATDDDFDAFDQTIRSLADEQLISELEKHGVFQRLGEIQKTANGLQKTLGDEQLIERWQSQWRDHWSARSDEITQALQWQVPDLAQAYADTRPPFWLRWIPGVGGKLAQNAVADSQTPAPATTVTTRAVDHLIDPVALQRIDDGVAAFVHNARAENVHTDALSGVTARHRTELPARMTQTINKALHESLQKPGEAWQRWLHTSLGFLATLLPLAAMGWAGYKLVNGFAEGASSAIDYLGVNFAVHTAMLVGLAWAVPYVLHRKTKPSRVAAASRGLSQGLTDAMNEVQTHIDSGIEQVGQSRTQLLSELASVQDVAVQQSDRPAMSEAVQRLLIH